MAALWVKAMGLASPLGGAVQAAAAFRAGLAHPSPAPDVDVMFPGDDEPQPVSVHALPTATFGFSGVGRLVALLAEALVDLSASADLALLGPETGLFLALPDPAERGFGLGRDPDDDDPEDAAARLAALGARLVALSGAAAGVDLRRFRAQLLGGGNVAFARALAAAHQAIASRAVRSALVCAVDSLASPDCVALLATERRLKTGDQPVGLAPGEAAAAFLLEAPRRAQPGAEAEILVHEPVLGVDPRPLGSDAPSDGRALADCLVRAIGAAGGGGSTLVLVSDHDGETHRGHELGMMQHRLVALGARHLADAPTWLPASSFGSDGAASAALALAIGARGLARGYAGTSTVALLSSADAGERAAVAVTSVARGGKPS